MEIELKKTGSAFRFERYSNDSDRKKSEPSLDLDIWLNAVGIHC